MCAERGTELVFVGLKVIEMQVGASNSTRQSKIYARILYEFCNDYTLNACVCVCGGGGGNTLSRLRGNNSLEQPPASRAGTFKSRYSSVGKVTSVRLSNSALPARCENWSTNRNE